MEGGFSSIEISFNVISLSMSLYNGAKFPDYVFKEKQLNIIFFNFHDCFSDEFILALKQYLEKTGVNKIRINNIKPEGLAFNQTIETDKLPEKFNLAVKTTLTQDYIDSEVSFYMMTELAEIFAQDNENSFNLILDRSFDLAIFGASSNLFVEIFDAFKIQDIREYISSLLLSNYTEDIDKKIQRSYL